MVLNALQTYRRHASPNAIPAQVAALQRALQEQYGDAVQAVLFYGSCLHEVAADQGIVDLYLVVDDYRSVHRNLLPALMDRLLPPGVRYLQITADDGSVARAKYAVFSAADFVAGTSRRWFHGYLSARMAQPVAVLYTRDRAAEEQVFTALAQAVITVLSRVLPLQGETFCAADLWGQALRLSYASELRTERPGYVKKILARDPEYYQQVLARAAESLPAVEPAAKEGCYHVRSRASVRLWCRLSWFLRRLQGKCLSVLRLMKGLYTFQGGLDYIAWKLERHSGRKIVIPEKVHKRPLLYIWGTAWRLYRQGVFR